MNGWVGGWVEREEEDVPRYSYQILAGPRVTEGWVAARWWWEEEEEEEEEEGGGWW